MRADLSQEFGVTFTAEAGETDQTNARAIAQAVYELSTIDPGLPQSDEDPHFSHFVLMNFFRPRHGALSTSCLSIDHFGGKQLNLNLLYGGDGQLILLRQGLTFMTEALPFVATRACDLAICFRQEAERRGSSHCFRGQILRDRLERHTIVAAANESDWDLRRRAFLHMLSGRGPMVVPGVEFLHGRFQHELTLAEKGRMMRLGAATMLTWNEERIRGLVEATLAEYVIDPMATPPDDPRNN